MSDKIIKEVGNYIGVCVESCKNNLVGVWREYMRVRVTIDLFKPLKRRMKIRKSGDKWYWITFKYENVPTCFICGILGHPDKYCSRLFETAEQDMAKPYGSWMRDPFKGQVKPIGAKWLRNGGEEDDRNLNYGVNTVSVNNRNEKISPNYQNAEDKGENHGAGVIQIGEVGGLNGIRNNIKTAASIKVPTNKKNYSCRMKKKTD